MIIFFLLSLPHANSIYFNFSSFQPNDINITFQGDANVDSERLQLTKNTQTTNLNFSIGRALYSKQVRDAGQPEQNWNNGKIKDMT